MLLIDDGVRKPTSKDERFSARERERRARPADVG
jgi:hypothetical protein